MATVPRPRPDLRLIVVTDNHLARPRSVMEVARAALNAGASAIQLRDKLATARSLAEQAAALLPHVRASGALLFINDRLDVAVAAGADGVHLGPDDMPVSAARRIAPVDMLIGYSTDSPHRAREAEADGADYIGCGAVFGTGTKVDLGNERIGPTRLDEVARSVSVPVIGIGGISPDNVDQVAATGASGIAVVGAVMAATDPGAAVRCLLRPFHSEGPGSRREGSGGDSSRGDAGERTGR